MVVVKLSTSLLLPAELAEIGGAYIKAIEESALENPYILGVLALLAKDLATLNHAMAVVRKIELVNEVAELDNLRDDLFMAFRDLVSSFRLRRAAELKAAYEKIWPLIEQAGTTLYSLGYTEESGKMEAMFGEMDKTDKQEALTLMNAAGVYTDLKTTQGEFAALYSTRLNLESEKEYVTVTEARKPTNKHINFLLDAMEHLDEMEPDTHTDLIKKLNQITSTMLTTARARQTRKENDNDQPME